MRKTSLFKSGPVKWSKFEQSLPAAGQGLRTLPKPSHIEAREPVEIPDRDQD